MSDIVLSAGIRQNLLALQNTAQMMQTTQERLATGKKVNSALDNPLNYFTSQSLSTRANELSGLLDSMGTGIQTIQAANNGITAITSLVQQLQSTVSQARSDATTGTQAATPTTESAGSSTHQVTNTSSAGDNKLTFNIGNGIAVDVSTYTNPTVSSLTSNSKSDYTANESGAGKLKITTTTASGTSSFSVAFASKTSASGTTATSATLAHRIAAINAAATTAGSTVSASQDASGNLVLTNAAGTQMSVSSTGTGTVASDLGFGTGNNTATNGTAGGPLSLSQVIDAINNNSELSGKVSATAIYDSTNTTQVDGIKINNLSSTNSLTVDGLVTGTGAGAGITGASTDVTTLAAASGATLSTTRESLMNQFNNLLTQINNAASDSGFNGINLLNGDTLTLNFNENNTSNISVHTQNSSGNAFAITATNLGINTATTSQFASNSSLDTLSTTLSTALTSLQTQASSLGSQLSVVQTRQSFTNNMINTLQTGSDNLVLADSNLQGANMLALQTRQSLSTTALSLSAQSANAVLQLFQ